MSTYIVAARIDENGRARGGKQGDQTGREVCKQTLSGSGSWSRILRPPHGAQIIVKQALAAAANNNIGYDQNQRTTLYYAARAVGYDLSKVGPCECDCSSLVAVLCIAAGFAVSPDMYTGNERAALTRVGFTDIAYSAAALQPGDILWRSGHTAVCVGTDNTPAPAPSPTPAPSGNSSIKAVQSWLNSFVNAGLDVDGVRGPLTKRALVRAWQKVVGTAQDGIFGPKTRAATPVLKRGARGNAVKVLQGALICLGYDTGGFDGIFGGKTDSAVRAFQRAHGLSVDGQAGKNTFAALLTC